VAISHWHLARKGKMRDFKKLNVWQEAHSLVLAVYQATRKFTKEEMYCITSQLRRAVTSIPTNIAEGCGRNSKKKLYNFLNIAMGSSEVEYLLLLAHDLNYLSDVYSILNDQLLKLRKMLNVFMQQINDDIHTIGQVPYAKS